MLSEWPGLDTGVASMPWRPKYCYYKRKTPGHILSLPYSSYVALNSVLILDILHSFVFDNMKCRCGLLLFEDSPTQENHIAIDIGIFELCPEWFCRWQKMTSIFWPLLFLLLLVLFLSDDELDAYQSHSKHTINRRELIVDCHEFRF
jgi:hypothetical protein